jgi:hypothetical protein
MDILENCMSAVNGEAKRRVYSAEGYKTRVGSEYDLHDRRRAIVNLPPFLFLFFSLAPRIPLVLVELQ